MDDITTKVYEDGSEGSYMCSCCICDVVFIGHKRDILCGKDHRPEEGDCKHCRGTGYIENSLWLEEDNAVCFVCGGEG